MTAALDRIRRGSLATGVAGLAACLAGAAFSPGRFFHAYLYGYIFWLGVALGCLAIVMIHHVTGGAWGIAIRRLLESGARTVPAMALLFLPLLLGLRSLYLWARPEEVAHDELLRHKAAYLNVPFFMARAAIYFATWSLLVWLLHRWSRRQDSAAATGGAGYNGAGRRLQMISAGGLLAFVLTMTFASVDWVMSLEPHWFSTIHGLLLMAGQAVSAFCFVIAAAVLLSRFDPLSRMVTPSIVHDLAKLLFTFVLVWAYFALSQFLIIWSANLPEEIPWYLRRMKGGWEWVGALIILLHFALPFGLLLVTKVKRTPRLLVRVALLVFVMRLVDLYWMMAPAYQETGFGIHWMDAAAAVGIGGVWVHLFVRQIPKLPLLPIGDPYLQEALSHAHE